MHNEYGPFHNALQAGAQSPGRGAPRKLGHEPRYAQAPESQSIQQAKDTDVHRGCMTVSFAFWLVAPKEDHIERFPASVLPAGREELRALPPHQTM